MVNVQVLVIVVVNSIMRLKLVAPSLPEVGSCSNPGVLGYEKNGVMVLDF